MLKKIITSVIIALALMIPAFSTEVSAAVSVHYSIVEEYTDYVAAYNDDDDYGIIIDDMAGLLTESQEKGLIEYMAECSHGGHVMMVTTQENNYGNAETYAGAYYDSMFPGESGILFLIDMDTRQLRFYSEGQYQRVLTDGVMDIIGDNIYKKATAGDYYLCACKAFEQIATVLSGQRIAAPMKYASNACLAILLALIINYFFARRISKMAAPANSEIMKAIKSGYSFTNPGVKHLTTTRTYSPRSSSSGGGRSGGGGGGGHSSGGHSF